MILLLGQEIMIAIGNSDSVPRAITELRNIEGLTPKCGHVFETI